MKQSDDYVEVRDTVRDLARGVIARSIKDASSRKDLDAILFLYDADDLFCDAAGLMKEDIRQYANKTYSKETCHALYIAAMKWLVKLAREDDELKGLVLRELYA